MNKIFFEGKQIEGVQELREDVENFVILAAGNFPGCSQRKIIFPKNEVEIEEAEKTLKSKRRGYWIDRKRAAAELTIDIFRRICK